jgi:hypothetical protein
MLAVESIFVRELLREFFEELGYDRMNDIALVLEGMGVKHDHAEKFMKGFSFRSSKETKDEVAIKGLKLLYEKRNIIVGHLQRNEHLSTATYLESLFGSYLTPRGDAARPRITSEISDRWNAHQRAGDGFVRTGVYQLYRRFKPRSPLAPEREVSKSIDPDDILVIELMYFDSVAMEALLVTSEGNVYWGTAHLNEDRTLAMIFQRPIEGISTELKHRFYAVHARHRDHGSRNLYSGLYLKAGDITKRPLAGETIVKLLERNEHEPVYGRLEDLLKLSYRFLNVSGDPTLMAYIAGYDGDGRVDARTRDVPYIDALCKPGEAKIVLLREPIRATDSEALERLEAGRTLELRPYRRDNSESLATPS